MPLVTIDPTVKESARLRAQAWLAQTRERFRELGLAFTEPKVVEGERGLAVFEWLRAQKPLRELFLVFPAPQPESEGEELPLRYMRYCAEDAPDFPAGVVHDEDTFRLLWAWLERE